MLRVREQDCVFAAPGEPGHSNGARGALVPPEGLEEGLDRGECVRVAVVVEPWDEGVYPPHDVVSLESRLVNDTPAFQQRRLSVVSSLTVS